MASLPIPLLLGDCLPYLNKKTFSLNLIENYKHFSAIPCNYIFASFEIDLRALKTIMLEVILKTVQVTIEDSFLFRKIFQISLQKNPGCIIKYKSQDRLWTLRAGGYNRTSRPAS